MERRVVISGAPGTGKTTVAAVLANEFALPLLSLDLVKEALGDVLGLGDEEWSDRVGDAAAEVVFRLAVSFPASITEGWWRRARRDRAIQEFRGWTEVFCTCDPSVAEARMRTRRAEGRHPIHRDVINPALLKEASSVVASAMPLSLGSALIVVDTTELSDAEAIVAAVRSAVDAQDPDP
jgi:predicted kinase